MADHASVAILTPVNETEPIELGRTMYRKQVLRSGEFDYKGRKLNFTPDYLAKVVKAFKEQAYDTVPFMLADEKNAHTMDPNRYGGDVIGLEPTPDGLDAIVSLSDDAAALVRENPKFGVSVRLLEDLERMDGKKFPAALQHVLGTFDPRMTGMRPWQAVEMSNEGVDNVLDLTEIATPSGVDNKEGATVPETKTDDTKLLESLSPESLSKLTKLAELLNENGTFLEDDDDPDDYVEPTDAEKDRIAAQALAADATPPKDTSVDQKVVAASNASGEPTATEIELARRLDLAEQETSRLRIESAERRYVELKRDLAETSGIPPVAVDMCKEWLTGDNSIELSNGVTKDPGTDIVKMLRELGKQYGLVDLSGPTVFAENSGTGTVNDQDSFTANAAWAKEFIANHGMNS